MGTTYTITLRGGDPHLLQNSIDSLLQEINRSVSTYDSTSVISLFNQDYETYLSDADRREDLHEMFIDNFNLSKIIYTVSQGAFDPTVMPLVNYWGFGYTDKADFSEKDSVNIHNILKYIGFEKLELVNEKVQKLSDSIQLDFSAIAKGYGVDLVTDFLRSKDIKDFYVEIGGEVYAEGHNPNGKIWRTGINVPSPKSDVKAIQEVINIENKGIATSGNYRNFFVENGIIYSHTMNPVTGYPERNNLLSATIISDKCAISDGYATACMVLGYEKAKSMINKTEGIEGILIYSDKEGNMLTFDSTKQ